MSSVLERMEREVLPLVRKPARYLGAEIGARPAMAEARLRLVLVYPDLYELGMSNLGLKTLQALAAGSRAWRWSGLSPPGPMPRG